MMSPTICLLIALALIVVSSTNAFTTSMPTTSRRQSSMVFMADGETEEAKKSAPMVNGEQLEMMLQEWDTPLVIDAYATWYVLHRMLHRVCWLWSPRKSETRVSCRWMKIIVRTRLFLEGCTKWAHPSYKHGSDGNWLARHRKRRPLTVSSFLVDLWNFGFPCISFALARLQQTQTHTMMMIIRFRFIATQVRPVPAHEPGIRGGRQGHGG